MGRSPGFFDQDRRPRTRSTLMKQRENQGLPKGTLELLILRGEWGVAESGRRAKVYHLTASGRKELSARTQRWNELSGAISMVLRANLCGVPA